MGEVAGVGPVVAGPMVEYRRRLLAHEERAARLRAMHLWLGYARLALVVGFLAASWFGVFLKEGPRWLVLVPMALFVVVGVGLGRVSRRLGVARRAAGMYRLGVARVEDRGGGGGGGGG